MRISLPARTFVGDVSRPLHQAPTVVRPRPQPGALKRPLPSNTASIIPTLSPDTPSRPVFFPGTGVVVSTGIVEEKKQRRLRPSSAVDAAAAPGRTKSPTQPAPAPPPPAPRAKATTDDKGALSGFEARLFPGQPPVRFPLAGGRAAAAGSTPGGNSGCGLGPCRKPDEYLTELLAAAGLATARAPALECDPKTWVVSPTPAMVGSYDLAIIQAMRAADHAALAALADAGRSMNACNRFGESIVHMACRRGDAASAQLLVSRGASLKVVDDFGRTPLHDACWTPEPCFDVVTLLLDADPTMMLLLDRRGASPLAYVRPEHHRIWCAYLDFMKGRWFPPKAAPPPQEEKQQQEQPAAAAAAVSVAQLPPPRAVSDEDIQLGGVQLAQVPVTAATPEVPAARSPGRPQRKRVRT